MRLFGLLVCVLLIGGPHVAAIAQSAPSLSPAERQQQLQKLSDDLNNPNPLVRITVLEAVLAGNDGIARELATEIALGSSDEMMQSYTAKLLLSNTKLINVSVALPKDLQSRFDAAKGDDSAISQLKEEYQYALLFLSSLSNNVAFHFKALDVQTGAFTSICDRPYGAAAPMDGELSNTILQFQGQCGYNGTASTTCSATMHLEAHSRFVGLLSCTGLDTPLAASFSLR
ncbi:MAG: hypothetical protein HIU92_16315 [Proteobacteria bacterium]|nr:hypothetical protein [Pseudomonadota bacterium]